MIGYRAFLQQILDTAFIFLCMQLYNAGFRIRTMFQVAGIGRIETTNILERVSKELKRCSRIVDKACSYDTDRRKRRMSSKKKVS